MYTLLFVLWIILNGKVTVEIILVGLVLTALIGLAMHQLFDYTPARELQFLKRVPLFIGYIFVLIWEIIKANLTMMGIILHAGRHIEPVLVTFHSGLKSEFGRYVLANSITLTPGTITIDLHDDVLVVHCLRRDLLDTSPDNVFVRWIRRMEG